MLAEHLEQAKQFFLLGDRFMLQVKNGEHLMLKKYKILSFLFFTRIVSVVIVTFSFVQPVHAQNLTEAETLVPTSQETALSALADLPVRTVIDTTPLFSPMCSVHMDTIEGGWSFTIAEVSSNLPAWKAMDAITFGGSYVSPYKYQGWSGDDFYYGLTAGPASFDQKGINASIMMLSGLYCNKIQYLDRFGIYNYQKVRGTIIYFKDVMRAWNSSPATNQFTFLLYLRETLNWGKFSAAVWANPNSLAITATSPIVKRPDGSNQRWQCDQYAAERTIKLCWIPQATYLATNAFYVRADSTPYFSDLGSRFKDSGQTKKFGAVLYKFYVLR